MSTSSPPNNPSNILTRVASIVGLLAAALYFTGWIYRWAYYAFFQIEVTTLNLPFESFLIVPLQVFFGNLGAGDFTTLLRSLFTIIVAAILIQLTLQIITFANNKTC